MKYIHKPTGTVCESAKELPDHLFEKVADKPAPKKRTTRTAKTKE